MEDVSPIYVGNLVFDIVGMGRETQAAMFCGYVEIRTGTTFEASGLFRNKRQPESLCRFIYIDFVGVTLIF